LIPFLHGLNKIKALLRHFAWSRMVSQHLYGSGFDLPLSVREMWQLEYPMQLM